ncbi:hypothetical protein GCM10027432_06670 [Lysobacter fragariae]
MRGAGGTEGGIGLFFMGFACAVAGAWLLMNQVTVSGGSWLLWGYNSFGLSLVPFLLGVGLLFFNGRSAFGWLLLLASLVIILAGVLINLHIYFQSTSLFNTLMMLALLAGGIGMLARSLSAMRVRDAA